MKKFKYQIEIKAKNEDNAYWSMVKALRTSNVEFEGIVILGEVE